MKPVSRRGILAGLAVGTSVAAGQWIAATTLAFVPTGTRAQATGAALTTFLLLVCGFVLGRWTATRDGPPVPPSGPRFEPDVSGPGPGSDAPDALLRSSPRDARIGSGALGEYHAPFPTSAILAASALLSVLGLVAYFTPLGAWLGPPGSSEKGGMLRAMVAVDATCLTTGLILAIGASLGLGATRFTLAFTIGALALLSALSTGALAVAREASYDGNMVMAVFLGLVSGATFLTGLLLALLRRRLAFVEISLISLVASHGIFLSATFVPSWLRASNLPEEQILLGLFVVPVIGLFVVLTLGSSVGFLLRGGGRWDPGFKYETTLALRYLRAHDEEGMVGVVTKIAALGVMLGVTALIVVLSIMSGFEGDLKQKILGAHAHIVVSKHGDDFSEYVEVEEGLADLPGVDAAAAFVLGDAMISTDAGLSGTLVKGIDPASARATRDLRQNMIHGTIEALASPDRIPGAGRPLGSWPKGPSGEGDASTTSTTARSRTLPGILIGRELAKTLRAYVGDTVKLVSPVSEEIGPMGPTPKLRRFRVAGVFHAGMYEYDAKFTYLHMAEAQRFFGLRGRATGVELKVKDIDETAGIVESLKRRLGGPPYTVRDWREMNKELFSALLLEKLAMFIGLTMIIMVASFLIVATLVMIVLQRGKEIAILKSIGASDASIMKVFVVQGLVIGLGGALLGVILGLLICLILGSFVRLDEKIFYLDRLPVVVAWGEVAFIAVSAVVISYLATIYPAMTAARLRPVEGLRDD